jgi:hypothetical protein
MSCFEETKLWWYSVNARLVFVSLQHDILEANFVYIMEMSSGLLHHPMHMSTC